MLHPLHASVSKSERLYLSQLSLRRFGFFEGVFRPLKGQFVGVGDVLVSETT